MKNKRRKKALWLAKIYLEPYNLEPNNVTAIIGLWEGAENENDKLRTITNALESALNSSWELM